MIFLPPSERGKEKRKNRIFISSKMVQRKVANNKLGIQASSLKTEKKQAIIKPAFQNHYGKSKGGDLKAIKMKKSRSTKRPNVDISLHSSPEIHEVKQGILPSLGAATNTPSPKKPLSCKSPYTSPNYMKSTSSSEARKEKTIRAQNITSISKLHKVANTLNKTASFKKVRSLTKTPTFKHTRLGSCKKVGLCQTDLDVQRSTCSSTLKDSKFPAYLKLKPGATEAEGNSAFKICPYTYCSLNGHHHMSAPPLKRFLSSRRRLLKTLNARPEILSPRKDKASEYNMGKEEGNQSEDFFVKVYVPNQELATQVSESFSDGPCSETEFQGDLVQTEDTNLSGMIFSPDEEDYPPSPVQRQLSFECHTEVDSTISVSLDEYIGENSDMEWEEAQSPASHDNEIYAQTDYSDNQDKLGFELDDCARAYLEFLADKYPPYFHDEIVECWQFSDTDSFADSESTQTQTGESLEELLLITDGKNFEPNIKITEGYNLVDMENVHVGLEDESVERQGRIPLDLVETDGDSSNEENHMVHTAIEITEDASDFTMEKKEPKEDVIENISMITDDSENSSTQEKFCMADSDDLPKTDESRSRNEANASHVITDDRNSFLEESDADINCISRRSAYSIEDSDSSKVELHSFENNVIEMKASGPQELQKIEEADAPPAIGNKMQKAIECISKNGESDSNLKLLDGDNKLKRSLRCRKAHENIEEEKEFNPRGPNFLTIEPEPEGEKVDLRHQEMDDRRNAEEWMLDYALQKTVNQLAPARKKKVALLVEAFESVLPIPKFENRMRINSSGFSHARPIQACS